MHVTWCALAVAMAAHPYLRLGEQQFEAQAYAKAVKQLTLTAQLPELSREDRRRTMDLLAQSHLALGARAEAIDAYGALLAKDPHAPMPEGGPKVREAFRLAKERVYPKEFVALRRLDAAVGHVLLQVTDPWNLTSSFVLHQAKSATGPYSAVPLTREDDLVRAQLAADARAYYVDAKSADERVLAQLCSEREPCTVVRLEPSDVAVAGAATTNAAGSPNLVTAVTSSAAQPAPRPRWVNWVVSAVSFAAVVAATSLAILASIDSSAAGSASFASDRKNLDDSAITKATAAYVVGGVGLLGTLGATALWVF